MKPRLAYARVSPGVYEAMEPLERYLQGCGLPKTLLGLAQLRASQLNGCAFCLDMHWKDLRALGETELRLSTLDAWRECPCYTARERAVLEWTEAVTRVSDGHVPDAVYDIVRPHLTEKELCDLTLAVAAINAWNRISIAGRLVPGSYQPSAVSVPA